jgi:hypothetical protein
MHVTMGSYRTPDARPFARRAYDDALSKVVMQRFNSNQPGPLCAARTGGPADVQYDASLLVHDLWFDLYLRDTPANRKTMNRLFDGLRAEHSGAVWATLGHGHAGLVSASMVGVGTNRLFNQHDEKLLTPPWRSHVGRLWTIVPEVARKAEAFCAKHGKIAEIDKHGLSITLAPSKTPTDRGAARVATQRAFSTLQLACRKLVNTALHDRKHRRAIAEAWSATES